MKSKCDYYNPPCQVGNSIFKTFIPALPRSCLLCPHEWSIFPCYFTCLPGSVPLPRNGSKECSSMLLKFCLALMTSNASCLTPALATGTVYVRASCRQQKVLYSIIAGWRFRISISIAADRAWQIKKGYGNDTQRVVVYSGCSVKIGARNTNKHSLCLFPPLFPPEWQVLKEGAIAKVFHQWKMLLQRLLPSERGLPTEHMKCVVFLFSTINFTAIACLRLNEGECMCFLSE